jgi:hypothetical protein
MSVISRNAPLTYNPFTLRRSQSIKEKLVNAKQIGWESPVRYVVECAWFASARG